AARARPALRALSYTTLFRSPERARAGSACATRARSDKIDHRFVNSVVGNPMRKRTDSYYLLSLGCSKNTVDSESMARLLESEGLRGTDDPTRAEVLIVNTCGFI